MVRQPAGAVIGQRLGHAEHHDEREDGRPRGEMKLLLRDRRQNAPLEADHGAHEGVDDHEEPELGEVLAEPEADDARGWRTGGGRHARRLHVL